MKKFFLSFLLSCLTFPASVSANQARTTSDTQIVDRDYALSRVFPVEVTPSGIAIKIDSVINTAHLSHLGIVTIQGIDGKVCIPEIECGDQPAPTEILLRKIPNIEGFEEDQEATEDNSLMLFISAESGLYRFRLAPVNGLPKFTKVEIIEQPVEPLISDE